MGNVCESSSEARIAAARPLAGTFVRRESSSEGSNCRCTSLAAKALMAAANLIQTLITILIYAIIFRMVCAHCASELHHTGHSACAKYCTLCKESGHKQKRAGCKFRVCNKCGTSGHSASEYAHAKCSECGSTTHKSALSFACPEHKCDRSNRIVVPRVGAPCEFGHPPASRGRVEIADHGGAVLRRRGRRRAERRDRPHQLQRHSRTEGPQPKRLPSN